METIKIKNAKPVPQYIRAKDFRAKVHGDTVCEVPKDVGEKLLRDQPKDWIRVKETKPKKGGKE